MAAKTSELSDERVVTDGLLAANCPTLNGQNGDFPGHEHTN